MDAQKTLPDLMKIGFFIELPPKRQDFLASRLKKQAFGAGEEIIRAGRSGQFLGIIESGEVMLKNGTDQALSAGVGQTFGSEMLLNGKPSEFTVTAKSEVTIWILNRSDWQTPSPAKPRYIALPQLKKSVWITMIAAFALVLAVFTLGPALLERVNNTLPQRLAENGRYDLAENYLRFAVRLQPESARLYGFLGDLLAVQGQNQEATEAYQQALDLDEYLPWIHNNLGVALLDGGQIDEAIEHFQAAADLDPLQTAAYRNLGNAYYAQKKWDEAAATYQKALELDFTLLETKAAWAGLILNESRLVEARLIWEDVLLADPRHALALEGLGVVSLLENDPGLAILYFDAARYLDPDNIAMHFYLGLALEALERPSEAAAEYQYVIDQAADPDLVSLADSLLEVIQE
jgi:tetratricopeptide (TPR) repeat protein